MTDGSINKVLYNVDQRANTTEAEKKTARDNIGAVGLSDIEPVMDERYKLLQQPIDATFASFAVIDRYSQTANGVVDIHCSYIYPATESTNGLMSAGDKTKLDNIQSGAEVNVQASWTENDPASDSYIQNKPDLSQYATQQDLSGKQDVLTAGDNITITNNVISATAAPQQQASWTENDSSSVSYIQNKPDLATVATTGEYSDLLHVPDLTQYKTKQAVVGESFAANAVIDRFDQDANGVASIHCSYLSTATTSADGLMSSSDKLKLDGIASGAEANVQASWTENDSSSDSYIQNKPSNLVQDANYVHTDNNFSNADKAKLDGIEAGAEVNINADWTATEGDAVILHKPDLSIYATQTELNGKQDTLTAGDNITITNNVISATAAPQLNADWTATEGVQEILHKPDLSIYATQSDLADKQDTLTAGDNITITNNVISAASQVNADWDAVSGVSAIINKPTNLVQDADYHHTDNNFTTSEKQKLAGIQAGAEQNVQSDWTCEDTSSDQYILHRPTIPVVPPMKELVAGSGITLTEGNDSVTISNGLTAGNGINIIGNEVSVLAGTNLGFEGTPSIKQLSSPVAHHFSGTYSYATLGQLNADTVALLKNGTLEITPLRLYTGTANSAGVHFAICSITSNSSSTNIPDRQGYRLIADSTINSATSDSYSVVADTPITADFSTLHSSSNITWSTVEANPTSFYLAIVSWSSVYGYIDTLSYASSAATASSQTAPVAEHDYIDTEHLRLYANIPEIPASTQVVTMTATLPPVETPVTKLTIVDNGRVMNDTSSIGLLAPYGQQSDEGKVLTHHYSGSPGICWASWDAAPEAHTVGFIDVIL